MDNNKNPGQTKASLTQRKSEINSGEDLPDTPRDTQRLEPEEVTLDLPDVKDIPGQEHVYAPTLGALADTTISSDDEEGLGLLEDEADDAAIVMGTDADISRAELTMLQNADEDMPTKDDTGLRQAALDHQDFEGEPLNEEGLDSDVAGEDLDVPGAEADDANEEIGEEDEENNTYSLGGNK